MPSNVMGIDDYDRIQFVSGWQKILIPLKAILPKAKPPEQPLLRRSDFFCSCSSNMFSHQSELESDFLILLPQRKASRIGQAATTQPNKGYKKEKIRHNFCFCQH